MSAVLPGTIDKYEIIKPLGAGNFGHVYHVFDHALGAEKAIKILVASNPGDFMKSLEEAQILNKCQHKHIVSINEANIFPVNGTQRVVLDLEYIPEGSLEKAMATRWLSVKETVDHIRGALLGLEHAHAHGFLHRDVKPGNILLSTATPKLSDFGLATDAGSSLIGSAKGYRPHLPPEYFVSSTTSELTDVFAVGVTLFRSLSNISDWRAVIQAIPDLVQRMQAGTLISHLGYQEFIPDSLKRIVRKATHVNPTKRYVSAHEFRQRLDGIRFYIDWFRVSNYEWQGYCDRGKLHKCSVDSNLNKVTITVNGRRKLQDCRSFNTLSDAIVYMNSHIATTTLV